MTSNQIAYWNYVENARHNQQTEFAANTANDIRSHELSETERNNRAQNSLDSFRNSEMNRHNVRTESEAYRHNRVSEYNEAARTRSQERASRYAADSSRIASMYGSDRAYASSIYASDSRERASKYSADVSARTANRSTMANFVTSKNRIQAENQRAQLNSKTSYFTNAYSNVSAEQRNEASLKQSRENNIRDNKTRDTINRRDNATRLRTSLISSSMPLFTSGPSGASSSYGTIGGGRVAGYLR